MTESEWLQAIDPWALLQQLGSQAGERKRRLFACACCRRHWGLLLDPRSRRAVEEAERAADGEPPAAEEEQLWAAAGRAAAAARAREGEAEAARDLAADADQEARRQARDTYLAPALLLQAAAEDAAAHAAYVEAEARARVAAVVAEELRALPCPQLLPEELAEAAVLTREGGFWQARAARWHHRAGVEFERPAPRTRSGRAARLAQVYKVIEDTEEAAAKGEGQRTERGRKAEGAAQCALLRDLFGNPFRPPPPLDPAYLAWGDGAVRKVAEGIYEERAFDRLPILGDALEDAGCADAAILSHCRQGGEHARGCWLIDLLLGRS